MPSKPSPLKTAQIDRNDTRAFTKQKTTAGTNLNGKLLCENAQNISQNVSNKMCRVSYNLSNVKVMDFFRFGRYLRSEANLENCSDILICTYRIVYYAVLCN
jgi:hypothetical protein